MTEPSLGIVISNAVFPSIIMYSGWRSVFTIGAVMILVITIFFFMAVKTEPKERILGKPVQNKTVSQEKVTLKGVVQACKNRTYICGTIGCFIILAASTGLNTYLLIYFMEVRGLSVVEGGAIIAASSFVGLIANSLSGILSDILKSRKKVIVPSFFITALGVAFLIVFTGKISLIAAVFIKDIFFLFATRPLNVQIAETTAGSPYVASTSGFYNAIANLGMALGPVVLGAVLDQTQNYTFLMWTIVVMICVAGVFEIFTRETYGVD